MGRRHSAEAYAHPSVTALNRYIVPHTAEEVGGIDVEPVVKDEEIENTLELLYQAAMCVCVCVNQMLDGTQGGNALNGLADEYIALSKAARKYVETECSSRAVANRLGNLYWQLSRGRRRGVTGETQGSPTVIGDPSWS